MIYTHETKLLRKERKKERIKKKERSELLSNSVPRPGIEPGWIAPLVFETSASTDSAIWALAFLRLQRYNYFFILQNF